MEPETYKEAKGHDFPSAFPLRIPKENKNGAYKSIFNQLIHLKIYNYNRKDTI